MIYAPLFQNTRLRCCAGGGSQFATPSEAKLNLARRTHRSTDELLGQAVDYLVAYNEWLERKVRNSMAAEGSQTVPDEAVEAWLERRERTPRGRGSASPLHDGD